MCPNIVFLHLYKRSLGARLLFYVSAFLFLFHFILLAMNFSISVSMLSIYVINTIAVAISAMHVCPEYR